MLAASVGNAFEWYDFTIYALFAIQIARNFFPDDSNAVGLIKAFLAFGVGFIARPVGAVLIGVYADRAGRKAALTTTILLMAAGTLLIAITPIYAVIGVGAPLLILAGRILQGLSAGGEIGGAAAFLVEQAPPEQRGRYAAWLQASMAFSNILGATVAFLVSRLLDPEQLGNWGWRIPFLLGLLIAPIGFWLRGRLEETPAFEAARLAAPRVSAPVRELFAHHRAALATAFAISVLWAVCVYVLVIFLPIHVQRVFGIAPADAFAASLVANVCLGLGCLAFGLLADRIGRRRMLGAGAFGLLVAVPPLLMWLAASPTFGVLLIVQSVFCLLVAAFSASAPAALAQLFPVAVRATGMSIAYNAAVTVFGGFAPAILTWLASRDGGVLAPAWFVMAAAAIGLLGINALPRGLDRACESGDGLVRKCGCTPRLDRWYTRRDNRRSHR